MTPSWPQDGPKIGSKHLEPVWNQFGTKTSWFQTGSKLVPNWFQTFGTSLEPVWNQNELVPNWFGTNSFWFQTGSKLVPRWTLTRNLRYFFALQQSLSPTWPKMAPREPKMTPCWLQDGPKGPQDGPTRPQDDPKLAPRWPQDWFQTFGTSLEPVWNQNELVPNWFQTGSKLVPNIWNQFGTSLEPKRVGSKLVWNQLVLVPNWFQTGSKVDFDT